MKAILDRITARIADLGTTDRAISLRATGSPDTIRNWQRSLRDGKTPNPQTAKLNAIIEALGLDLSNPDDQPEIRTAAAYGLSESAVPYTFTAHATDSSDPQASLRAIWGTACTTPATYRLATAMPAFGLAAGDVLVADLARLPRPGELALVTIADESDASATTVVRRYLPPYLAAGTLDTENSPLRVDHPGVTVRYPVVGTIRGLPE